MKAAAGISISQAVPVQHSSPRRRTSSLRSGVARRPRGHNNSSLGSFGVNPDADQAVASARRAWLRRPQSDALWNRRDGIRSLRRFCGSLRWGCRLREREGWARTDRGARGQRAEYPRHGRAHTIANHWPVAILASFRSQTLMSKIANELAELRAWSMLPARAGKRGAGGLEGGGELRWVAVRRHGCHRGTRYGKGKARHHNETV